MLRTRRRLSRAALAALSAVVVCAPFAYPSAAVADSTDGTLTVVVDLDVNGNGVYDSPDEPQAGIDITVTDSAGTVEEGTTSDDGTYTLTASKGLVGGRYFVVAEIPAEHSDLSPVPESDTYAALSTTVDVTSDDQTVRMGVVAKEPDVVPTEEPVPEPTEKATAVEQKPAAPRFALGDLVWNDLNRSGTQDPDEPPAVRVSVQLLDGDGDVLRSDVTSSTGHYWFDKLEAGTYTVRFAGLPNGHRLTQTGVGDGADDSDADATGATAPITLGVDAPGTRAATPADGVAADYVNPNVDAGIVPLRFAIGDHVWADLNSDGIEQDDEPPASASVSLLDGRFDVVARTTTDAQGHYEFTGLTPDTYHVQFYNLPGNRAFTVQGAGSDPARDSDVDPATGLSNEVVLKQGSNSLQPATDAELASADYVESGVNAGLVGAYSIGDTVWQDLNGNGVLDPGDHGVGGVKVQLTDVVAKRVIATTKTISSGRYSFRTLPAGTYRVKFSRLPSGFVFTAPHQGGNAGVDSDVNSAGESADITLSDDNPMDTTVDAGLTTAAGYQASAAGAGGAAPAADTELSSTGGVEPAIPIGGLALVGAGAACLVVARRRRRDRAVRAAADSDPSSGPPPPPGH